MKFIVVFLFLCANVMLGQNKSQDVWYAKTFESKSKAYPNAIYFKKGQHFFNKKKWDTTLVYAMKQLSKKNNVEINNY